MKTLYQYYILLFLNLTLVLVFFPSMILSFINGNLFMLLVDSIIVASTIDEIIDKHRDFMNYYPYFEDKWLKIF